MMRAADRLGTAFGKEFTISGLFLSLLWILASRGQIPPDSPAPGTQDLALQRFSFTEYHMGVDVRIVVYASGRTIAETAVADAFERIAALDTIMSDYRPASELMRLSTKAGGPPVPVSPDLYVVLERARQVASRSHGAFDPTAGPLIALWRRARKDHILPPPKAIARARRLVGWRMLHLNPQSRTVRLLTPGMKLELGGIAKGYAGDQAQIVLARHGITRALVEAGGDIVVSGSPPGTTGWRIEVANARTKSGPAELLFANRAISTSGDTEQSVIIGGRRYSHIIDPRTGVALTDRIQVTIVAPNGLTSDSLSTAVSVLGEKKGRLLVKTYPGTKCYVRFLGKWGQTRQKRGYRPETGETPVDWRTYGQGAGNRR